MGGTVDDDGLGCGDVLVGDGVEVEVEGVGVGDRLVWCGTGDSVRLGTDVGVAAGVTDTADRYGGRTSSQRANTARNRPLSTRVEVRGRPVMRRLRARGWCRVRRRR